MAGTSLDKPGHDGRTSSPSAKTRFALLPGHDERDESSSNSSRRLPRLAQVSLIGEPDSVLERGAGAPAELVEAADVEQFARRAVGPRGVEADCPGIADHTCNDAREIGDGDVLAGADVDEFPAGI